MSYQQTEIVGNLGGDPEMKYSAGGKPYTKFSVAVTEKWTGNDGKKTEETTWYRATCFEKKAELAAEHLKKGNQVMLKGKVKAGAWIDKDGNAQASLDLTVNELIFLNNGDRKANGSAGGSTAPTPTAEEDIPF